MYAYMTYCGETFTFTSPIYGQKYESREITQRINSHYYLCYMHVLRMW